MKKILVLGAGGFIGSHLANRLADEGNDVWGLDLKKPMLTPSYPNFIDPVDIRNTAPAIGGFFSFEKTGDWKKNDLWFDETYVLAADMGGAGFVFTGSHDADILHNSVQINLNALEFARQHGTKKIFFSSSACVYKEIPNDPTCREDNAYPAMPDSDYGWEKLFSERLYQAYARNYGLQVRIARYHNIFGPYGTFEGGREKAPAALCRKVAEARPGEHIEIWGDGSQLRSFLYIDECVEATIRLMRSDFEGPVNVGSEEMVSIKELAEMIIFISGRKDIGIKYVPGPIGVNGRNSDNTLIREKLNWAPSGKLVEGLRKTYAWVAEQVGKRNSI